MEINPPSTTSIHWSEQVQNFRNVDRNEIVDKIHKFEKQMETFSNQNVRKEREVYAVPGLTKSVCSSKNLPDGSTWSIALLNEALRAPVFQCR